MRLSGNVFAYWYSNTRDYAVKRYAIKRTYLAQKRCFWFCHLVFYANKWDMQLSGMRLSGFVCIVNLDEQPEYRYYTCKDLWAVGPCVLMVWP